MMSYNKALPLPVTHTQLLAFNLNQFLRGHLVVTPVQWAGVPFPSATSGADSQRLGALSTGTPRLFPPRRAARAAGGLPRPLPPRPQCEPPVRSQEVFRQDPGPVCRAGGGGFSGAEFAPFPSPPPTSSGDGAALLWSFSVPLFCEPPAVCSGRLISPLLSHSLKNLPQTALRAFWPVPTLRNAAGSSPVRPLLLVAGAGVWGTFLLGVAFST